jgi:hypothetical protein
LAPCACALALLFLAGCGGAPGVDGTVTFDGAPVDGGSITFTPEGGSGTPGSAVITAGKYSIGADKKMAPGKYKVEIIWNKKTGKTIPNTNDPGTTVDETKQVIPSKYNSKTELTAEVKPGANTFNFELKAGGPVDSGKPGSGPKTKAAGD